MPPSDYFVLKWAVCMPPSDYFVLKLAVCMPPGYYFLCSILLCVKIGIMNRLIFIAARICLIFMLLTNQEMHYR